MDKAGINLPFPKAVFYPDAYYGFTVGQTTPPDADPCPRKKQPHPIKPGAVVL